MGDAIKAGKIKMSFTGRGTVKNPDGTTREIILRGEKLVTEEEAKRYGYHAGSGRDQGRN